MGAERPDALHRSLVEDGYQVFVLGWGEQPFVSWPALPKETKAALLGHLAQREGGLGAT